MNRLTKLAVTQLAVAQPAVTQRMAFWLALMATLAFVLVPPSSAANNTAVMERVGEDIRYLSSDELEGRGPGTKGLQQAAEYIRDRFHELGLRGAGDGNVNMRPFELAIDTRVIQTRTSLILRGPQDQQLVLKAGENYQPLAIGGPGTVKAGVVFAGYGISAPKLEYDDFQDADLEGKVLIIIRREPQQDNSESVFDGKRVTAHSYIRTKIQAAKNNKAAAILMVNDPFTTNKNKQDQLTLPNGFGSDTEGLPFAHVKQSVVNQLFEQSPVKSGQEHLTSVQAISGKIDETLTPMTHSFEGWTAELEFTFEQVKADVSNVVGVLEGEGPLADETIVIGAHYDHLGYGPFGSRRPAERAIHNGADDNATGTAAILELARRFADRKEKPARRLVFIAFTAEERGLVGSNRYLEDPLFPMENTVAMLNFDMIGHLREEGLIVGGVRTAKEFAGLVDKVSESGDLKVRTGGPVGGSDHVGFNRKGVPVLFFFTGMTDIFHTPDDDFETINVPGAVQTIDFAERVLHEVVSLPKRPEYVNSVRRNRGRGAVAYLGIVPDYTDGAGGLRLSDVNEDSPADKAGLKKGDVIIKFGDLEVADFQGLRNGLRKFRAGQEVDVLVRRGEEEKTLPVKLGRPPRSP